MLVQFQLAAQLRSKFASSCFCKSVSRKGAKEQSGKENTVDSYLGSFAPLREMFGWGCAAVRPLRLGGYVS